MTSEEKLKLKLAQQRELDEKLVVVEELFEELRKKADAFQRSFRFDGKTYYPRPTEANVVKVADEMPDYDESYEESYEDD